MYFQLAVYYFFFFFFFVCVRFALILLHFMAWWKEKLKDTGNRRRVLVMILTVPLIVGSTIGLFKNKRPESAPGNPITKARQEGQ
jgi:predicted permease